MPASAIPGREISGSWKNLSSVTWSWATGQPAWARSIADGDMAFWNAYLPQTRRSPESTLEAAEPQSGISGLKSLVQSVKGEAERNAITTALERPAGTAKPRPGC